MNRLKKNVAVLLRKCYRILFSLEQKILRRQSEVRLVQGQRMLLDKMERIRSRNSRLARMILRISLEAHDRVACAVLEEEGKIVRRISTKKKRRKQQAISNSQVNSRMSSSINLCAQKAVGEHSTRKHSKSTFLFARNSSNRRNLHRKCQTRSLKRIRTIQRRINPVRSNRNYHLSRRKHQQE